MDLTKLKFFTARVCYKPRNRSTTVSGLKMISMERALLFMAKNFTSATLYVIKGTGMAMLIICIKVITKGTLNLEPKMAMANLYGLIKIFIMVTGGMANAKVRVL
jgi:hypothetical protein